MSWIGWAAIGMVGANVLAIFWLWLMVKKEERRDRREQRKGR